MKTDPNPKKLTTQIKFKDAQAEFVHEAREKLSLSATAFCQLAAIQAAASVLGRPAPEGPPARQTTFGEKGSRIPEAKALGLTSAEYKRRVKVLNLAGFEVSNENVARVPAAIPRVKKAAA